MINGTMLGFYNPKSQWSTFELLTVSTLADLARSYCRPRALTRRRSTIIMFKP